jgi:hypothetical protein
VNSRVCLVRSPIPSAGLMPAGTRQDEQTEATAHAALGSTFTGFEETTLGS